MAKILSVDDSASMRDLIVYTVINAGHQITSAVDGFDGLNRVSEQKFDLILTDFNMPNMNGVQFVEALRQLPDYRFTPVLMLTTETSAEIKKAAKESGATGWVSKPFEPGQLLATIQRVLD